MNITKFEIVFLVHHAVKLAMWWLSQPNLRGRFAAECELDQYQLLWLVVHNDTAIFRDYLAHKYDRCHSQSSRNKHCFRSHCLSLTAVAIVSWLLLSTCFPELTSHAQWYAFYRCAQLAMCVQQSINKYRFIN